MVYNTWHYWVFGLCPSSDILKTRKHNVSETHLKTETDPLSEILCFLAFIIPDDGKSLKTQ
jgi:hypothetical protein